MPTGINTCNNIDCDVIEVLAECWHGTYLKEEIMDALEAQIRPKNALALLRTVRILLE